MNQKLRSPRVQMAGWVHLPRFIDKIRLHQAGQLPADYQNNFGKGFDGYWLEASGLSKEIFFDVVRQAKDDSELEAWVKTQASKSPAEIEAYNQRVLQRGRNDDATPRLQELKKNAGLANRADIQTFVDFIDADEGRL